MCSLFSAETHLFTSDSLSAHFHSGRSVGCIAFLCVFSISVPLITEQITEMMKPSRINLLDSVSFLPFSESVCLVMTQEIRGLQGVLHECPWETQHLSITVLCRVS